MKKLTRRMIDEIENGSIKYAGHWDAGAVYNLSLDWDCDEYMISADEVLKSLRKHLKKWDGIKKFGVDSVRIDIGYVR